MGVAQGDRYSANVFAAGSGRSQDWNWPDNYVNGITTTCLARSGATRVASQGIAGGASVVVGNANGVDFAQLVTGAAVDLIQYTFDQVFNLHLRTSPGGDGVAADNDFECYRVYSRMMFGGINPINDAGHDFGFSVARTLGTTGCVLKDAADGWHVQLQDGNVVVLYVRGPNGLVALPVTAAPFDTTQLHTYEMIFQNATVTQQARFVFKIDGSPIALPTLTSRWGGGSNNPLSVLTGGRSGFRPMVVNFAGNVAGNGLFVARVKMISAPDPANTA